MRQDEVAGSTRIFSFAVKRVTPVAKGTYSLKIQYE